jgi:hypothetical protein
MSFRSISFGPVWHRCATSAVLVAVAAIFATSAAASDELPSVTNLQIGFANHYKLGCWTPVEVTLSGALGDSGASGRVDIAAPDSDDVLAWFIGPRLIWTEGSSHLAYVRVGRPDQPLHVRLTKLGSVEDRPPELLSASTERSSTPVALPATEEFILEVGASMGLADMVRHQQQHELSHTTVVTLEKPFHDYERPLPDRWYGYEGVDLVAIVGDSSTDQSNLKRSFYNNAAVNALDQWVRLGGSLIIACGDGAEKLFGNEPSLARFAPGDLASTHTLPNGQFGPIENFVGAGERLTANSMRVPQWKNLDPSAQIELSVGVGQSELPLVIRRPWGLGQVLVVGLDLHRDPLATWPGRSKFLEKLLRRGPSQSESSGALVGAAHAKRLGFNDLSGQLRGALDQFDGVNLIPFWLVAVLALLYIGLLFPLNYWIVTRWLRRPVLAWVVFPATAILFCAAALALANQSKGGTLRMNQLDLVDVELPGGNTRGTTWFNLFSPENALFDLELNPLFGGPSKSQTGNDRAGQGEHKPESTLPLLAWFGLPGAGLGGLNSKTVNPPLFDQPYTIDPTQGTIDGAPLSIWSSRSFIARWQAAGGGIEAELSATPLPNRRLRGSVTNHFDAPLTDCIALFENRVYPIGAIKPSQSQSLDMLDPNSISLETYLTKRRLQAMREEIQPYDRAGFEISRILEMMMFYEKAGGANYTGLSNRYQVFVDLGNQLDFGRAILLAHGPAGAQIELNGKPADDEQNQHTTIYRFILPVKSRD